MRETKKEARNRLKRKANVDRGKERKKEGRKRLEREGDVKGRKDT